MIGLPFFLGGLALHQHMSIEALNLPKCLRQWKKRKKKKQGKYPLTCYHVDVAAAPDARGQFGVVRKVLAVHTGMAYAERSQVGH
jgi:hypothetical protein